MKNKAQSILSLIFLGYAVWWLSFQHVVEKQGVAIQWFGSTYGLVALIASIIGFRAARKWGGFKTVLGKALTFFSLGLLAQEAGQLIYAYYIYAAKIQIPYPSWGDVAYFGSVLLYCCAALFLTKAVGAKFSLKDTRYKVVAFIVPAILLVTSYGILLYNHQYDYSHPLTVFLDFGYPIGQAIYISTAVTAYILSRKILGGAIRPAILLVIMALFMQYVSDFTFVYQSSRDAYLAGNIDDFFYLLSYFAMAIALLRFHAVYDNLRKAHRSPAPPNVDTRGP